MSFIEPAQSLSQILAGDLTIEEKWSVIRWHLPEVIEAGYSQAGAARFFRDLGYTFGDHPFRDLWREITGTLSWNEIVNALPLDKVAPAHLIERAQYPLPARYRTTLRYTYYDAENDAYGEDGITVQFNDKITLAEQIETARNYIEQKYKRFLIDAWFVRMLVGKVE